MPSLESELDAARALDVDALADTIEAVGFECTRCGACCKGHGDDHVATVFPDEIRDVMARGHDYTDVARPMPFGLDGAGGETFEWALQTDACGDCAFYRETDGEGACSIYADRPSICETYPFSADLGDGDPLGDVVERRGPLRVHECEGVGRDIDREDAVELARAVKRRAVGDLEEAIAVRDAYEPVATAPGEVVVHDSEGAKRSDGSPIE